MQLARDCSDHALDVRVLPGRTRGRNHVGDAHSLTRSRKTNAVGRVAMAEEIARGSSLGMPRQLVAQSTHSSANFSGYAPNPPAKRNRFS